MQADKFIHAYRRLRDQPLWRLIAADNGPTLIGLLQAHLAGEEKRLPASILHERLGQDIEELRRRGENFPKTAQAYVADWLKAGYLERRFPEGSPEETYELTTQAAGAIRFATQLTGPRVVATESRLAVVIQQLVRLADESDSDPSSRIAALRLERERLDRAISAIEGGQFKPLAADRAIERLREISALAEELTGDFRRVRDLFAGLNRDLRERLMDEDGQRGRVLEGLFAGVDVIAESEAGRSFAAFWRLLTDPEQSAALETALDQILQRDFAARLSADERRFLLRLTGSLLAEGGGVHEVVHSFARSLRHFVQSREYLEQRRLNQLLKEAQRLAVGIKERLGPHEALGYELQLTSAKVNSYARWVLYDPSLASFAAGMPVGAAGDVDLDTLGAWIAQSEIDFRELRANIRAALASVGQISVGELLAAFPAKQGLGSVVGYLSLASRCAVAGGGEESAGWRGGDGEERSAQIPVLYFLREALDEL